MAEISVEIGKIESTIWTLKAQMIAFEGLKGALVSCYNDNMQAMGESEDLLVFNKKYSDMIKEMESMLKIWSDYCDKLSKIAENYSVAQKGALYRALSIPK